MAAPAQPAPAGLQCPEKKELCVQAERSGGINLKTGIAHLEGNVVGFLRSRKLHFQGQSLTAFRDGQEEWVRLVLEREVRITQEGRVSESERGVLQKEEVLLTGNVRMEEEDMRIEGEEMLFESDIRRTIVWGKRDKPLKMLVRRLLLPPPEEEPAKPDAPAIGETVNGETVSAATGTTLLKSQKAVLEEETNRTSLTGGVVVEQSDGRLKIDADNVLLKFKPDSTLDYFRAEGNVVIVQPDRHISADFAESRNLLKSILLVGHASMRQVGEFDVTSDRMEVYTDSSQGIMESQDGNRPITLSLDLARGSPYLLDPARMISLSEKGVPPATLEKLAPLQGQTFKKRSDFTQAVESRLSKGEFDRYRDVILATAR